MVQVFDLSLKFNLYVTDLRQTNFVTADGMSALRVGVKNWVLILACYTLLLLQTAQCLRHPSNCEETKVILNSSNVL